MKSNCNAIIEKAITKTKNKTLHWSCLNSKPSLYIPPSVQNNIFCAVHIEQEPVINQESFFAPFNDGYLFLICRYDYVSTNISKPITLTLEAQENHYAKEIASTDSSDPDTCASLKRLYNLVEDHCSNLESFLDSFLNS